MSPPSNGGECQDASPNPTTLDEETNVPDTVNPIPTSAEAMPWRGNVARMQVIVPRKGVKRRAKMLKLQKSALEQILCRSPTVELVWRNSEGDGRSREGVGSTPALVDTGADWSLINPSILTDEERDALNAEGSELVGRDVQGDDLCILGEVWRDCQLGDLLVTGHRFVVVERMTTDVILGADFWGRVSPVQLDFNGGKMTVCGGRVSVGMKCSHQPTSVEGVRQVKVSGDHRLPANTEALVRVKAKGMKGGQSYLFQPLQSFQI